MANTSASSSAQEMSPLAQVFWCCFYAIGLIGMLALYGVLQERIMTMPYGGHIFGFSVFLVFLNRVAAVVFSAVMLRLSGEEVLPQAPLWKYLIISLSNVYASSCQYEALKHVTFVVQMLGKSFKMMPVMLWGMAVSGKKYGIRDWGVAACVTLGVTEFLLTGPTTSSHKHHDSFVGYLWLLAFLALDGATSTFEEKLFKEQKTSKYNQMMYVNGLSSLVSFITLIATGSLVPAFGFWGSHGRFLLDSLVLSVSAVGGQFFIFSQVKEFGALVFAATMNVRQVVSIIVSYIHFHHRITGWQVLGLLVVFAALFYKSVRALYDSTAAAAAKAEEKTPLLPEKVEKLENAEKTENLQKEEEHDPEAALGKDTPPEGS